MTGVKQTNTTWATKSTEDNLRNLEQREGA